TLSTSINGLTQIANEVKSILTSSDVKGQLETTKHSIDSLKRRLDIYEQNQNKFVTFMQRISTEHGIKIQRIEDTLMTATTILENLSTTTTVLQTNMNSLLPYIQNREDTTNISNITNNSPHTLTTRNPILTAKIHDKMQTNKKWNEPTITEIAEAYFKTLKKKRNTTPAVKLLNNQCARRRKQRERKSSNRLAALNKIPENQLNHPKSEIEKLFSFEATSPE
ncbi:32038_t:CDS:2, partial [Racocetra persica]